MSGFFVFGTYKQPAEMLRHTIVMKCKYKIHNYSKRGVLTHFWKRITVILLCNRVKTGRNHILYGIYTTKSPIDTILNENVQNECVFIQYRDDFLIIYTEYIQVYVTFDKIYKSKYRQPYTFYTTHTYYYIFNKQMIKIMYIL